jgi:hypothetical protein
VFDDSNRDLRRSPCTGGSRSCRVHRIWLLILPFRICCGLNSITPRCGGRNWLEQANLPGADAEHATIYDRNDNDNDE